MALTFISIVQEILEGMEVSSKRHSGWRESFECFA
jgi:hypothetical protein